MATQNEKDENIVIMFGILALVLLVSAAVGIIMGLIR